MTNITAAAGMQTGMHFKEVGHSTKMEDKKLRKRLQNRENQRARNQKLIFVHAKLRLQAENAGRNKTKHPFQVRRWRVGSPEPHTSHAEPELDANRLHRQCTRGISIQTKAISPSSETDLDDESGSILCPENPGHLPPGVMQEYTSRLPRSAGQLLSLIQYNVFQGLHHNKVLLGRTVLSYEPGQAPLRFDRAFPKSGMLVPDSSNVPEKLYPTKLQRDQLHSSWISMFPFPAMRENLIRWETSFNHPEFCRDVLGPLFNPRYCFNQPGGVSVTRPTIKGRLIEPDEGDVDDGLTAGRQGFIVWDEPHLVNSWKLPLGF